MNELPKLTTEQGTALPAHAVLLPAALRDLLAFSGHDVSVASLADTLIKSRRLIGAAMLGGAVIALAISLLSTPKYRAHVTLELDQNTDRIIQVGNVQPVALRDIDYLATQIGVMKSWSLAERVAAKLNFPNDKHIVSQSLPLKARNDRAAAFVASRFDAEPIRNSRLVSLTVTDTDPARAARIANAYADGYIGLGLDRHLETSAYARSYLERQLAATKARLEKSERDLVAYARAQGIIDLASGSDKPNGSDASLTTNSLVALNDALNQAQAQRIDAEARLREAKIAGTAAATNNSVVQQMRADLDKLEGQYQQNLGVFKPSYPTMVRLQQQIDQQKTAIAHEMATIENAANRSAEADYQTAKTKEEEFLAKVDSLKSDALDMRDRSIKYTILQREVGTNRSLYDGLLQRYKEVGVAAEVGSSQAYVVDRARIPQGAVSPRTYLNVLLGIIAGLILGVGIAFARDLGHDKIETAEDLERKLGIRPLGVVPSVSGKDTFIAEADDPRSSISEAYHSVATSLRFATANGTPRSLLISSSRSAEGKSSTSYALAQIFAKRGLRVVLVDADMRQPTFISGKSEAPGLSHVLVGESGLSKAIQSTAHDNLFLLPSGALPPNPAEILAGPQLETIIQELSDAFDLVIVDGPPVLGLADAPLLATNVEGIVAVFESGSISRGAASATLARLRATHGNVIGGILTKFEDKDGGAYGYRYSYGYGKRSGLTNSRKAGQRLIDLNQA